MLILFDCPQRHLPTGDRCDVGNYRRGYFAVSAVVGVIARSQICIHVVNLVELQDTMQVLIVQSLDNRSGEIVKRPAPCGTT